ncbi:MAG: hypothetical protein PHF84_09650 [bacterium]|nr:hypothetical protein [bacterium]
MIKRLFPIFILCFLFFLSCEDKEYKVDYDKKKVEVKYRDGIISFKNNLDVPVVLDNVKINENETANFIKYKVCDYVKYRGEVVVNYSDKVNQIISLTSILLPGKTKEIKQEVRKGEEIVFEFSPVNYIFLSDNVYFLDRAISSNEVKYKQYPEGEVKKLKLSFIKTNERDKLTEIDGIMIYVKEYEALSDHLEYKEMEF